MKSIFLFIFLPFFITSVVFSQNIFEKNKSSPKGAELFCQNDNILDSVSLQSIDSLKHQIKYIPETEFNYADTRRYILVGGTPQIETKIKLVPSAIFAGTLTGLFILQHQMQMKTIWKDHSPLFRIQEDGPQELWLDKVGHVYGAYTSAYFLREGLIASGLSWKAANNWAAILGVTYSTYVEILDGYGAHWGFSPSDWYADIAGGIFFAAQNYVPFLQNFSPKFLYVPSEWTGYTSRIPHDMFIDDYSSQFFFMSINVYNILPDKWKKYYPEWLELSIGYTVRNILENLHPDRQHLVPCDECVSWEPGYWGSPRLVIALDYNLAKLLPNGGNTWNWFKQTLNLFKLPSPALEIGKVTRFYIVFPFKLY